MNFKFRLEKVLHFTRLEETVKKMEVSSLVQRVAFLEKRSVRLDEGIRELLAKSAERLDPHWAHFHNTKIILDVKEVERMQKLISEEKEHLTLKQRELGEVLRKKKALEALREKKLKDFRVHDGRKKQKILDDIHSIARQRNGGGS